MAERMIQVTDFPSRDLSEALVSSGTTNPEVNTASPLYAHSPQSLKLGPGSTPSVYELPVGFNLSGNEFPACSTSSQCGIVNDGVAVGVAIQITGDKTPAARRKLIELEGDNATTMWSLWLETNGNLVLEDSTSTTVHTETDPFTLGQWHVIEMTAGAEGASRDEHKLYIDRTLIDEDTGTGTWNFDQANNGAERIRFGGMGASEGTVIIGAVYATGSDSAITDPPPIVSIASDQLFEVASYVNSVASATPTSGRTTNDSNLHSGQWNDAAEIPLDTATPTAQYNTGGALYDGAVDFDGPNGDANVGASATIVGGRWWYWCQRSGGSGTSHTIWIGNSADNCRSPSGATTISLPTSAVQKAYTASAGTDVPAYNEDFAQGIGISEEGSRAWLCHEMYASLLYVPPAPAAGGSLATPSKVNMNMLLRR